MFALNDAKSLSRHLEDVRSMVLGVAMLGDWGQVDICYDGEKVGRAQVMAADLKALTDAGYRARRVGRSLGLAIDMNNVGDAFLARYVK